MDPVCPTCNQTVKPKAKVRYDTLAEQQAAWLADRLAQHQEITITSASRRFVTALTPPGPKHVAS